MWENNIDDMLGRLCNDIAKETEMEFNPGNRSMSGKMNGFYLSYAVADMMHTYLQASIRKDGQLPDADFLKGAKKLKGVRSAKVIGNKACFTIGGGYSDKAQAESAILAMKNLTEYFRENGYVNACEHCGAATEEITIYSANGECSHLCEACMENPAEAVLDKHVEAFNVKENIPAGIVGAFLGAIVGALVIVLFGVMGLIASFGGVALAFMTVTGYEKFAKKLSIKGIVISVIMMILTIVFVMRLEWTIDIYSEMVKYDDSISALAIFLNMTAILKEFDVVGDYVREETALFLFTGFGAFPTIKKKYIEKKALTEAAKAKSMREIATNVEE